MPFLTQTIGSHNLQPLTNQAVKQENTYLNLQESVSPDSDRQGIQGKWNYSQNFDFVIFIAYYHDIFSSKPKRKSCKIFKIFESYLIKRTAAQCRSHFQKMIIRFKTVAKIRNYYERYYGKQPFIFRFNEFKTFWEQKHPPIVQKNQTMKTHREIAIQTDTPTLINQQQQMCSNCCLSWSWQIDSQKNEDSVYNSDYWKQFYNQKIGAFYYMSSAINVSHQQF